MLELFIVDSIRYKSIKSEGPCFLMLQEYLDVRLTSSSYVTESETNLLQSLCVSIELRLFSQIDDICESIFKEYFVNDAIIIDSQDVADSIQGRYLDRGILGLHAFTKL